jgi:hypothetical protein
MKEKNTSRFEGDYEKISHESVTEEEIKKIKKLLEEQKDTDEEEPATPD